GSYVGQNPSSLAQPGETRIYRYYAPAEGTYLISSAADPTKNQWPKDPQSTQAGGGLFGAANVQPRRAADHRRQGTRGALQAATYPVVRTREGMRVGGSDTMTITSLRLPEEATPRAPAAPSVDRPAPARGRVATLSRFDPALRTTLTAKVEVT